MLNSPSRLAFAAGFIALLAAPLPAQTVLNGDHSITGGLCVGASCTNNENLISNTLIIKDYVTYILFEDTSTQAGFSTNDWQIAINDSASTSAYFAIVDYETGNKALRIDAGAPASALHIQESGNIGLGTSMPAADLHIVSGNTPTIRLEQDGSGGYTPRIWSVYANAGEFGLSDDTGGTTPFRVRFSAPEEALFIGINELEMNRQNAANFSFQVHGANDPYAFFVKGSTDNVGIGTNSPKSTMHILGDEGDTQLQIEEASGTQTARPLLNMINHGRPDIIMANTATGGEWAFGAGTNFVLKNGAVGSEDAAKTLQLKLYGATGNLEIAGQIITGGPTCAGGCDAVFSESYDLPSISEHAEAMFALGHLPNVGPTAPNQPVNMSEQYGKLLNELEHAHIYIAELEEQLRGQKSENAAMARRQNGRIAALEARMAALAPRQ